MSMLRKSIQLTHCKDMGVLTIIRIGSSVGVKLTLTEKPEEFPLYLALKIGGQREFVGEITDCEQEFAPDMSIYSDDYIGVIILTKDACVFCAGGRRELVNIKTVKEEIESIINKRELSIPESINEEPEVKLEGNATEIAPVENSADDEKEMNEASGIVSEESVEQTETNERESLPFFGEKGPFVPRAGENFYRSARERFNELFTIYPREEEVSKIIPESEWVRVNYDGDDYYLIGLLKDGDEVTHIGYGIPGNAKTKPPKEVANMCDFLPMPDNGDKGWWLMFQNPADGTMIVN